MKVLITALTVFLVGQFCLAQENSSYNTFEYDYKNVLKLSPFELGRAEFQIGYERYLKNRTRSIVIMPSIIIGQKGLETKDGIQLMLQYRFYLSQLQKETSATLNMFNIGFYTAPYILGVHHNEIYEFGFYDPITQNYETDLMEETTDALEGGALMGVQLDITKRIVLDIFAGGGIRKSNVVQNKPNEGDDGYGIFDLGYTGVKPRIGFQMGITF